MLFSATTLDGTLRVSTFLLHFSSALFLLSIAFRCGDAFNARSYTETATNTLGFPIITGSPCDDPHTRECFFGTPQMYATLQRGFEWNPLALLAAFEWLSASFALYYLKDTLWVGSEAFGCAVSSICLLWNAVGLVVFMPFSLPVTLLQSSLSALALIAATAVQALEEVRVGLEIDPSHAEDEWERVKFTQGGDAADQGLSKQDFSLPDLQNSDPYNGPYSPYLPNPPQPHRYFYPPTPEQRQAATPRQPKQVIFKRGSQKWVVPTAPNNTDTKGITPEAAAAALSQSRVTLHYSEYCASASLLLAAVLVLFVVNPLSWASLVGITGILLCNLAGIAAHCCKLDQHTRTTTHWLDLDWTKEGNHFKLFILHSWTVLLLSMFVIIYFGWQDLTNDSVPTWVRFILWNLLVTYSLFGIWATLCYWMAGTRVEPERFERWMGRLDYGLTVLSVAAKLPVAYTVFYGLIRTPGGGGVC